MPDVRSVSATPIVADFADTRGTPLVVDRVGKTVYFLDVDDVRKVLQKQIIAVEKHLRDLGVSV